MQVSAVTTSHESRDVEKEAESPPQALVILEYIAARNANARILKNEVVLFVQGEMYRK